MSRNSVTQILRENEAVTKAAMAYGAEKEIATTQTVEVQGWEQEIPEANGVFNALMALQQDEHLRAKDLLAELNETTDGRRRGEIRRHYNTVCKNIARNNDVLNALMDKKVGAPKKASKKSRKSTKKASPKKEATEDKPRPTPEQVKEAASQRRTRGSRGPAGRRAKLEALSFAELQQWAKKRGVKANGSKEAIIQRILDA